MVFLKEGCNLIIALLVRAELLQLVREVLKKVLLSWTQSLVLPLLAFSVLLLLTGLQTLVWIDLRMCLCPFLPHFPNSANTKH